MTLTQEQEQVCSMYSEFGWSFTVQEQDGTVVGEKREGIKTVLAIVKPDGEHFVRTKVKL